MNSNSASLVRGIVAIHEQGEVSLQVITDCETLFFPVDCPLTLILSLQSAAAKERTYQEEMARKASKGETWTQDCSMNC